MPATCSRSCSSLRPGGAANTEVPQADIATPGDLVREVFGRYRQGGYAAALELLDEHGSLLPEAERAWYQMSLRARVGDLVGAVSALRDEIERGGWFDEASLRDPDLDPLRDDPEFERLSGLSPMRKREAEARAHATFHLVTPESAPPPDGCPVVIALHGNSSNAELTAKDWSAAVADGWLVGAIQSSQVGRRRGAFVWNDSELARREIRQQFAAIERTYPVARTRIVLGGFSLGAFQAALMALRGDIPARAFVMVAPGIPGVEALEEAARERGDTGTQGSVIVGTSDPGVGRARKLATALTDLGFRCELDEREGLGHEYPADFPETLRNALKLVSR